jgi:stearoyl-CoA desaturase (delta-9 desaturase)
MYNRVMKQKSKPAKEGVNWHTATFMALFHIGAVAALFMFDWKALVAAVVLWWISASLGVGMGFHRLLTHRGYKTPKLVEYFITFCGLLALEGGAINWVVTHRIHHAHTDAPGDPHTPREGGWWAHIGWMLKGTAQSHDQATMARYAPDMVKDRFHVLANNFYWVPIILLAIGLFAFGGWPFVLWAVFFRVTFNFHSTWLVNSATHMWGRRRFATRDDSTNNWWVALLTFGEGWHNNHHAFPTAARHGLAWYEIDINWWGIRTMQFLRLAKGVKLVRLAEVTAT